MKTRKQALEYGLSFPDTYIDAPFHDDNWQLVRYKGNKKVFLWTYEKDGYINLNVKVDPEKAFFWRKIYKSVLPGYHQNKEHWNTIILDGSIPEGDIRNMIAESYSLIADSPTKRIYEAVKRIPEGCVATYAQVAEAAGDRFRSNGPGGFRIVGPRGGERLRRRSAKRTPRRAGSMCATKSVRRGRANEH